MSDFDSADCLARLRAQLGIGTNTADSADADLYILLSNGQRKLIQILAAHCPWTQVTAPTALSTADSGVTYTFPSSAFPVGHLQLYDGPNGIEILPVTYGSNDLNGYVLEGDLVRFPGNRARTFTNGLYARYVADPSALVISAASEPVLMPQYARQGIVYEAAIEWCSQGGAVADPAPFQSNLNRFLWGDRETPGDVGLIGTLKTQHRPKATRTVPGPWWRTLG